MNFISVFLFYTFASSIVFIYGIGLERLYIHSKSSKTIHIFFIKNSVFIFLAVTFMWFFNLYVLIPTGTSFLLPVFIITFILLQECLFKFILKNFIYDVEKEAVFTYGLIFFVLYEAASYIEALAMIVSSIFTGFVFSYILRAVKQKTDYGSTGEQWKPVPLVLISLGFILMAFTLMDTAWFFDFL